jgi:hypothetical protein
MWGMFLFFCGCRLDWEWLASPNHTIINTSAYYNDASSEKEPVSLGQ